MCFCIFYFGTRFSLILFCFIVFLHYDSFRGLNIHDYFCTDWEVLQASQTTHISSAAKETNQFIHNFFVVDE